jgi:putative two-component system response regulator
MHTHDILKNITSNLKTDAEMKAGKFMSIDHSRLRILAIEAQIDNASLLHTALKLMGYHRCEIESDPWEAVARFHAQAFDLVLLDYDRSAMSGLDVLAAMADKADREHIPIVIITSKNDQETRLATLRNGAKDFLNKPIDLVEFHVRVSNLLESRLLYLQQSENRRLLEEKVNQRDAAWQASTLEFIRRLAYAAECRDNETGTHLQRMSFYSHRIGYAVGLPPPELALLLEASPMHDIGKIGISDSVLLKPGKFTPEEFVVMQQHTVIGAKILEGSSSKLIQTARDIALYHHERWNGTGYPYGLRGKAIPLFARIVSVADVFDALTTSRSYKKSWPTDAAFREIMALSGSFFDPEVVAAFEACFDDILQIQMSFETSSALDCMNENVVQSLILQL